MTVLLVILHADASRGGAEAYTVTLFHKLLEAGHDVRLAAATFEPSVPRDRRVPLRFRGVSRIERYIGLVYALRRHVEAGVYDVVHTMLPVSVGNVYHPHAGLEAVGWQRLPWLRRLTNVRRRAFVNVERKHLAGPTPPLTLCLSDRARDEAATLFGRPERFVTLYSGVDETRFVPGPPRSTGGPPVCVFVGQDFVRKGLSTAIRAVAGHPTAILRVVGKGDPRPFARVLAECRVGDRVRFVGATRDVAKQLQDADLLLLPAKQEPFGMVAVEAMLCGVPAVVSAACGVAEVVRDGVDGRVVAGDTAADWTAAIDDVLARRPAMAAACLARRAELSYAGHLRTLLALYERTLAERPAAV